MEAHEFQARFGYEPAQDDLERVNCDKQGEVGHFQCGVCGRCGARPRFECGHAVFRAADAHEWK